MSWRVRLCSALTLAAVVAAAVLFIEPAPQAQAQTCAHAPTPSSLLATTGGAGAVDLSWPATGGCTTGYYIYYSTVNNVYGVTAGTSPTQGIIQVGNATGWTVSGLKANTFYYFWLWSHGPADSQSLGYAAASAYSGASSVGGCAHAPNPPSLSASTGSNPGTVALNWPSAGGCTTGYYIYYSTVNNVYGVTPGTSPAQGIIQVGNTTGWTVSGLKADTCYYFWLWSYGPGDSQSLAFATASACTGTQASCAHAPTPANLNASTGSTTGTVNLSWPAAGGCTTGYYIYYSTVNNVYGVTPGTSPTQGIIQVGNTTGWTVSGLKADTCYYFWLWSYGPGDSQSLAFATASACTGTEASCAHAPTPANLNASTGSSTGTVNLSWPAAGGCTTGYYIYYSTVNNVYGVTPGTSPTQGIIQVGNTTGWTVSGLKADTCYYFWLWSYGPGDSQSLAFATASACTGTQASPPAQPTYGPFWVNDLAYGSPGGGFYWDPVSGLVWTAQRSWHQFFPQPPRSTNLVLWVNDYAYPSAGQGFYLDPLSNMVWTAERGWHYFRP